jgi:putative addiction module killer protein
MAIKVLAYERPDGSIPFKEWFDGLDRQAAAKVYTAHNRIEQGLLSSVKWFGGIGEYVIDWGPGYRVYLAKDGADLIVLFGGSTKKDQQGAIERAKMLHNEYKALKKAAKTGKPSSSKSKKG